MLINALKRFGIAFIYGAGFITGCVVVLFLGAKLFNTFQWHSPDIHEHRHQTRYKSWEGLSLEEKIKLSTAIIITTNSIDSGTKKSTVAEILKLKDQTQINFKIGDPYPELNSKIENDTVYGEKDIVLLDGSPASMRESWSVYSDAVPGLNNIKLSEFRELVKKNKN